MLTPGGDTVTLNGAPGQANVGNGGGIGHFGFWVDSDDLEPVARVLEAAGGTVLHRGDHGPTRPFVMIRDPDGYAIELCPQ